MKHTLTVIFLILSILLILDSFNAGHAIMLFVLAGIIPGTDIVLSADRSLELIAVVIGVTIGRISWRIGLALVNGVAGLGLLLVGRRNTLRPQV